MENIDVQDKAGKRFKPGDLVYIKRHILHPERRIGLVCKLAGQIKDREIYQILIGKEFKLYNEYYLEILDDDIIQDYKRMRKN